MHSTMTLGRGERIAWVLVVPLVLYLLLTGAGAWQGVYLTQFRLVSDGLLVLVFSGWALAAWRTPAARPDTTLWVSIAAILTALSIATATSARPRMGIDYLAYASTLAGLYLLLVRLLGRPPIARRLVILVATCTIVIAGAYVGVTITKWVEWWSLVGAFAMPPMRPEYLGLMYGAPGIMTAFLVSAGGASVAMLWPWGRRWRAMAVIIATLVLVASFLASARGGWAGLAAATAAATVVAVLTGSRLQIPRARRPRVLIAGAGVTAFVLLLAAVPSLLQRFIGGGGGELRRTLAETALQLFADHPGTGAGPGTWVTYRGALTDHLGIDYYIPHAHNLPLQLLAETGLAGLLAATVTAALAIRLVWRALRSRSESRRATAIGAVFVVTYLAVHQLVDFFMDMPAVLFVAVLPIATLDAAALDGRPTASLQRWRAAIPAALALVMLGQVVGIDRPAMLSESAFAALPQDPAAAQQLVEAAIAADPAYPPYAWIDAHALARAGRPTEAATAFRKFAEQDDMPQAWLNLAYLELDMGEVQQANADLDRALRLGVQQPAVAVAAIPLLLRADRLEDAVRAARAALTVVPQLADDPWWQSDPGLSTVHARAVRGLAETGHPSAKWQIAMYLGDWPSARKAAASLRDPATPLLVIDAWAGIAGARQRLEDAAVASPQRSYPEWPEAEFTDVEDVVQRLGPSSSGLAQWAASVATKEGDHGAADRFRRWAALGYGSVSGGLGYDTTITMGSTGPLQVPGPNPWYEFRFAYRRTVPLDLLLDGLPRLTLQ